MSKPSSSEVLGAFNAAMVQIRDNAATFTSQLTVLASKLAECVVYLNHSDRARAIVVLSAACNLEYELTCATEVCSTFSETLGLDDELAAFDESTLESALEPCESCQSTRSACKALTPPAIKCCPDCSHAGREG